MPRNPASVALIVPVKEFSKAKTRLSPVCCAAERAALAKRLFLQLLAAAEGSTVLVVTALEALDVRATCASRQGIVMVDEPPGSGLNGAAGAGLDVATTAGFNRAVVVHADLPFVTSLTWLTCDLGERSVTLVTDHHGDGTTVISLPTGFPFCFAYGPGSLTRHKAEAERLGLECQVVNHHPQLSYDLDTPEDLQNYRLDSTAAR